MAAKCPTDETIFTEAVQFVTPARWEAFLVERCAGDEELRHRVRGLLAAHQDLGEFREQPSAEANPLDVEPQPTEAPSSENTGCRVGPYKLREQLGEGGMGVVYVAEQTEPVKRKVALKIIKPGMASKDVVARFEAERQALAMMDHPNIAKVHDGGTTDSGQPYFVMELVCGVSLAEYCDERSLTTNERLQIFLKVCRAVQHAHQKGIIHRDLKPSNVLVASIDDEAVPKVIDFGVAKATGQKLTEETVYTQVSQLVGTPLYMSPEQVELGVADVDTRSDVYSLGVLLYELLTGHTPFASDRLKQVGFDEMRRIIREEEPPKPSAMVSTLKADALSTISQRRRSDPRKLSESLSGELDWLVMKALERDRIRRYESASALADDVERYLNQEPIAAGPPSLAYRFRKYAQRNKGKLIAASLALSLLLVIAIGAGGAALQARQERRELTQAVEQSLAEARTALEAGDLNLADSRLSEAKGRLGDSRQEVDRLTELVEQLDNEVIERINDLANFERFQKLANEVIVGAEEFGDRERQAVIKNIEEALANYGIVSDADWIEGVRQSSLNEDQLEEVIELAYELLLYFADALRPRPWEETRDGEDAPEALRLLNVATKFHEPTRALYWLRSECQDAIGRDEEAEASQLLVESTPAVTALDYYFPAKRAYRNGDAEKAFEGYEAALRIQPNHFKTLFFYGLDLSDSGNVERAADLYRACLAIRPDHYAVICNLGIRNFNSGDYEVALHWLRKAFERNPKSPENCRVLATTYEALGRFDEAVGVYDKIIGLYGRSWRAERPGALASVYLDRASSLARGLKDEAALRDIERAIELDSDNIFVLGSRAYALMILGRFDEALAAENQTISVHANSSDPKDRHLARMLSQRARIYCGLGRYDEALQDLEEALKLGAEEGAVHRDAAVIHVTCQHEPIYDPELATTYAKKATEIWPNSGTSLTLALAHYREGEFADAIASCDESLSNPSWGSERGSAFFLQAMVQWELGKRESALDSYRQGVEWQRSTGVEQDRYRLRKETEALLDMDEPTDDDNIEETGPSVKAIETNDQPSQR